MLFAGVSFALQPGGAARITGPNGAGKSSLLRVAAGLLDPAAGRIIRDGRLALADENAALDRDRTLADALGFWARLDGRADQVATALAAVELVALAPVPVRMLSTGQRKRAALARVIAGGADIWLLDEPTNGLDTAAIARLEQVCAAHRARGGIVVAATHQPLDLADAIEVAVAPPAEPEDWDDD
jgi:heme exporter protein A